MPRKILYSMRIYISDLIHMCCDQSSFECHIFGLGRYVQLLHSGMVTSSTSGLVMPVMKPGCELPCALKRGENMVR
jgi:hypothetical protein